MLKRILKEYSFYTFSFFISAIVTILCAFISCPDANHWCSSFLSLIFTIASAVLANCIFCLFQVIIPEQKAKKEIAGKLTNELEIILKLMTAPIKVHYKIRYGQTKELSEMTKEELDSVFQPEQWQKKSDVRTIQMENRTYADVAMQSIRDANERINKLIVRYYNYVSPELLRTLYEVQDSNYFKLISVDFPSFFTNKQSVTIYPSAFDLPAFRQYCDRLEQEKNGIIKKYPEIFSKTISRA